MSAHSTARSGGAGGTEEHSPQVLDVRYACWTVYAKSAPIVDDRATLAEVSSWASGLDADQVALRGAYDVSGMRAGADLMLWLHAPRLESLQAALRRFRSATLASCIVPVFSVMGAHRRAEFSADHVPAFMSGREPRRWLSVYPFARSYDWYLLPESERREMLSEHGLAGRAFAGVQANTVAAFALNDWEWILALEADDPLELVDLLRSLRATRARRHVREETPFYTGRRVELAEAIELLR